MVSCNKEKSKDTIPERNKLPLFAFSYVDTNGIDLLDSNNANAYNIDNMLLYYIKDGVREIVYDNNYDYPRNISLSCGYSPPVVPSNISCMLVIALSDSTLLEIGSNITDTICLENDGHTVRYNGEVVWDLNRDIGKPKIGFIVK